MHLQSQLSAIQSKLTIRFTTMAQISRFFDNQIRRERLVSLLIDKRE